MNKTESTLIIVLGLILLVVLGVVAWGHYGATVRAELGGQASLSQSVSLSNPATTTASGLTVSGEATSSNSATVTTTSSAVTTSPVETSTTPNTALTSTVVEPTLVPAAGWTIYRDGEYGVEGTYPQAWFEYDAVSLGGSLQFTSVPSTAATTGGTINNGAAEISIYRTPETLTQARAEDSLNGTQEAATTATVAGESVAVIGYQIGSTENTLVAYVPHDGYIYRITLGYHGESEFDSIYTDFLGTFEFTN